MTKEQLVEKIKESLDDLTSGYDNAVEAIEIAELCEQYKNDTSIEKCLIEAIKVVRHSRNVLFSVTPKHLRSEAVMTEVKIEELLGKEKYESVCKKAFKK